MYKFFTAAVAATTLFAGAATAATVSGSWQVNAINVVGINGADSAATVDNFDDAAIEAIAGTAGYTATSFFYSGDLDFGTSDPTDATTIADWLATGVNGVVSTLLPSFGALQLSAPNISNGTATTTFFQFVDFGAGDYAAGDLTITHDDGVLVYGDPFLTTSQGGFAGPNGVRDTEVSYSGGLFDLLYVATNGDPSRLSVDLEVAAVPLPAGLPLMLLGLGGIAALRRRKHAS